MTVFNFHNIVWKAFVVLLTLLVAANTALAACFKPYSISVNNASIHDVTIELNDFNSPEDVVLYEYLVVIHNEDPDFTQIDTSYNKIIALSNLDSGQSYRIFIRTICESGETEFSNGFVFSTHISGINPCESDLILKDNNCNNPDTIYFNNISLQDSIGYNIFINSIDLSIEHPWPADLEVSLMSPSGKVIPLFADLGTGFQNIGNPINPCVETLTLDMNACENISNSNQLSGTYRPEGNMELLYDGSDPSGIWKMIICDDAQGQTGIVKYANIDFVDFICSGPEELYIQELQASQIELIVPPSNCDSLQIQFQEMESGEWTTLYISCTGDTLNIENLSPSTEYMLNFTPMCEGNVFTTSCPSNFTTRCSDANYYETFDFQDSCAIGCSSVCNLENSIWFNNGTMNWSVRNGSTPTVFTGPEAGNHNHGNYLYIESSQADCGGTSAELISQCLFVDESMDCNLSFAYHMFGNDINTLFLEIRDNSFGQWDTLWQLSGSQGNQWWDANINLNNYLNKSIQFRFTTIVPEGNFGDIALDDIVLSGLSLVVDSLLFIYPDEDKDGYGIDMDFIMYCGAEAPEGFSFISGDCDDQNPDVNPGEVESPCNSLDDNCNGLFDETTNILEYQLEEIQHQTCFGINDGKITLSVSNGNPPYSFFWSDGNQDSLRTDLSKGYYSGYIEDASGCQVSIDSIEVDILQKFDYLINSIDSASCLGINDGNITVLHDETNAPFDYLWNTGDTTQNLSNATSGNYYLSITDVNGCLIETNPIVIPARRAIKITADSIENIQCFGENNGYISVVIDNNRGNISYNWNSNSTEPTLSDLQAGIYMLTVSDTTNCYSTAEFEIEEPLPLSISIAANDPVLCYGESNGALEVQVEGGTAPYEINWNDGGKGFMNNNLEAGTYSATISDHNNCIDSIENIMLNQPDSMSFSELIVEPVICTNNQGEISLQVEGGSGEYRYFWNDGENHKNHADSLMTGNYSVTILDAFDCKLSEENIGISQIDIPLNISETTHIDSDCYTDTTGTLKIEITNSTSLPITYFINNQPDTSNSAIFDLTDVSVGTYEIYAKDNNGCLSEVFLTTLEIPDTLKVMIDSVSPVSCTGKNDGEIYLSISGGIPQYSIDLNDEQITGPIDSLSEGNYDIIVTDEAGCVSVTISAEISAPILFDVENIVKQDPICYGSQNGFIIFEPSGGTLPYSFIFDGELRDSFKIENLSGGTYTYSLSDANNCIQLNDSIILQEPAPIEINVESTKNAFCGNANGHIFLDVAGGEGNLNYTWYYENNTELDTFSTADEAYAQNLSAGNYEVISIDENNCMDTIFGINIQSLEKLPELSVDSIVNVRCYGNENGKIFTSVTGIELKFPFQFFIDDQLVENTDNDSITIPNLPAGTYTISFEDADGCVSEITGAQIIEPDPIVYEFNEVSPILCYGDTNAILNISAFGGNGIKDYLWSNGENNDTLFNLGKGKYACAIVDSINCVLFSDTIFIDEPDSLYFTSQVINATGGENNGAIYINTIGGTEPYMYFWNPELPTFVDTLESLDESTWELQIVDAHGCAIDTVFIVDRIVKTESIEMNEIGIYPNPTDEELIIDSELLINQVWLINLNGQTIYHNESLDQKAISIDVSHLVSGIYFLQLELEKGMKITEKIVVK